MAEVGRHRLKGWKSIAAYLRVNESTAIRWSKEAEFPVVRSGSRGTVYADPARLDQWLTRSRQPAPPEASDDARPPAEAPAAPPSVSGHAVVRPPRRRWLPAALVGALVVLSPAAIWWGSKYRVHAAATPVVAAPPPPGVTRAYLAARADWAARTPEKLAAATAGFEKLVGAHPDYAPAFSGLADAYLLSCEFSTMDRPAAFRRARAAVTTAAALTPDDPDTQRIIGFLDYWTDRDIDRAAPHFERAVGAPGASYLAYLWYGNALIDAGRLADGQERLAQAMRLGPDSPAVLTDYAIARWQAGASHEAIALLREVEARFPAHSSAPGAAALFLFADDDLAGYLDQSRRWAAGIGDARQRERIDREAATFASGGRDALLRAMIASEPLDSAFWHGGDLITAIAASKLGDRAALIRLLRQPQIRHANWRRLRFPAASFVRWQDDRPVADLLDHAFSAAPFDRYPRS